MAYTSHLLPEIYKSQPEGSETGVQNGTIASSALFSDIAEQQHWIGLRGLNSCNIALPPLIHQSTGAAEIFRFRVLIPPFVEFMGMRFFASGDRVSRNNQLVISSTATSDQVKTKILETFDSSGTPAGSHSVTTARWVYCVGTVDETADQPRALRVSSSPDPGWNQDTIDIDIESGLQVYSAYYFFHPATQYDVP